MKSLLLAITLFSLAFTAGCANPINAKTATNYAQAAAQAQNAGDCTNAKMYWSRAIMNAQHGGATPNQLAVLNYEYGRSSGVVCDFAEAERALIVAHDLDSKSGGPTFLSLFELARLNYDQKKFPESISCFERAFPVAEEKGANKAAPIATADLLDEYSRALQNVGRTSDAQAAATRAILLRRGSPVGRSITDRTPYGKQCQSNP